MRIVMFLASLVCFIFLILTILYSGEGNVIKAGGCFSVAMIALGLVLLPRDKE